MVAGKVPEEAISEEGIRNNAAGLTDEILEPQHIPVTMRYVVTISPDLLDEHQFVELLEQTFPFLPLSLPVTMKESVWTKNMIWLTPHKRTLEQNAKLGQHTQ